MSRTIIVGGGIAGLATAWALAERGAKDVVVVERRDRCGLESTAKNAAILRTLGGDPIATEIAIESGRLLREPPPGFSAEPLLDRCGLILYGTGQTAQALEEGVGRLPASVAVHALDRAELGRALPHVRIADGARGYLFPDDGRIRIDALVAGFFESARRGGVEFRLGSAVRSIDKDGERVSSVTLADGERLEAATVVLAAGGWAAQLGARLGSRAALRVTRRHLLVTEAAQEASEGWASDAPIAWCLERDFYSRPEHAGLMLCACDMDDVDPDACDARPTEGERIRSMAGDCLAIPVPATERFWAGLRTMTPDDSFAIGPDPDLPGLFWVAGLGGSGMLSAFSVGRAAADRLLGRPLPAGWQSYLDVTHRDHVPVSS